MRFDDRTDLNFDLNPLPFQLRNIFMQLCQTIVGFVQNFFSFHLSFSDNQFG